MVVIKSDGRYKYFPIGFHYIAIFRWHDRADKELFTKLNKGLEEMYGPLKKTPENSFQSWVWNEHWRAENNPRQKRRRIYVKNESDISFAMLKL